MLMGGLRYLFPVIEYAHSMGYYVITCDNVPDNPAHKLADKYYNINLIDKENLLKLARELKIDGVMSFGVDLGVVSAAYVACKMGLSQAGPYNSVCLLQDKEKFRRFLEDNGFNVPKAKGYAKYEDVLDDLDMFHWPVIVKPVDNAGSKGVTRVDSPDGLREAVTAALERSFLGRFIVEEFIETVGCSSDSDCFSVDGKLKFVSFSGQMFDDSAANPYTPSAYLWPSRMPDEYQKQLYNELQRLISLLEMGTSIYNIETRVGTDGKVYIMEVSPRGGGNRISEMLRIVTGEDLIKCAVQAALGEKPEGLEMPEYRSDLVEVILHSSRDGIFQSVDIAPELKSHVIEMDLWVSAGDEVHKFNGANNAIGTLVLEGAYEVEQIRELVKVKTK